MDSPPSSTHEYELTEGDRRGRSRLEVNEEMTILIVESVKGNGEGEVTMN